MEKTNIVFIITDQMRGDCLGCAGHPAVQTPNLDYLASRGTLFSQAYSAVPSCLPARASLWTGLNQWHTGVLGMGWGQGPIPNDFPVTLPGVVTTEGYRTHMVGKGHFHPYRASMGFETTELDESGRTMVEGYDDEYRTWFKKNAPSHVSPDDHGVFWNSWFSRPWHTEESLHPSAWTMNRALDFLQTRDRGRPFFLNVSFARPHSPYVPPRYYFDLYNEVDLPEPHRGDWADEHDVPYDGADPNAWRGKMTDDQIHRARAGYYGEISFIDQQIGRLINYLMRFDPEAYRNTWFVFTSDHGDMTGDHNLWRKTYAYEGSARIPLIVTPPLGAEKTMDSHRVPDRVDRVVELRDIMPTILDALGIESPRRLDGASLLPLMTGENVPWRTYLHGEHCRCYANEQEMQYVTDGKRKFIWLPRTDRYQFFDLEADPEELHNLIDKPERQEEIGRFKGYLAKELKERGCSWVKNGELVKPPDEPLVSPWRDIRWNPPAN